MVSLHPSVFRHAATAERMRERAAREGHVGGRRLYTADEDAVIRRLFPDLEALGRCLPHRTRSALKFRAGTLGLRAKQRTWTGREVSEIRERMRRGETQSAIAGALNATVPQIRDIKKRFKIHAPKRALVGFGAPMIDAVRHRARALNFSLNDLDREISRKGSYFGRGDRTRRIGIKLVERAVKVLGGRFQVLWDDD